MDSHSEPSPVSIGLVLSAGGDIADAWNKGVIHALQQASGWDPRHADLIVGTSAGALTGLALRSGLSAADMYAALRDEPLSAEGEELLSRIVTPYSEGRIEREWTDMAPQSPALAARALWPPWQPRPLHAAIGLLPRGAHTTQVLERRLSELHPDLWPKQRLWVTAVRLNDGERVVFGRDDVDVSVARAVRASCAVPLRYEPVRVNGVSYVDGGVHSYTNADLMGPPAFDLVVVCSAMSGSAGWSKVTGSLNQAFSTVVSGIGQSVKRNRGSGEAAAADRSTEQSWLCDALDQAWSDGRALRTARRQWVDDKLKAEKHDLQRRGIDVLDVAPDADGVEMLDNADPDSPISKADIAELAYDSTLRRLSASPAGRRMGDLLNSAAR